MMIVPVSAPKAPTPIAMLLPQSDQVWINYVNTWIALKTERGFFEELGRQMEASALSCRRRPRGPADGNAGMPMPRVPVPPSWPRRPERP